MDLGTHFMHRFFQIVHAQNQYSEKVYFENSFHQNEMSNFSRRIREIFHATKHFF